MALVFKRKDGGSGVSAYDDAIMFYMMLGDGVLDGVYSSLSAAWSNGTLTVQPGIIVFGGRLVEVERGSAVAVAASAARDYVFLRVTINGDDSQSSASFQTRESAPSGSSTPANGVGTYDMPLWWINSDGSVSELFHRIKPGVAKNCVNLLSGGTINGVAFSNIFNSSGHALHALEATTAGTANGFVGSNNQVSSNLYMPNRGVYLLQEAVLLSGASLNLDPGESIPLEFADSASLSYYEGITAVYFGTGGSLSRVDYGGAYVEQSMTFKVNDSLEAFVSRTSKTVTFTNISSVIYLATGIGMRVLLYGGTA